jgi:hypothetical protein
MAARDAREPVAVDVALLAIEDGTGGLRPFVMLGVTDGTAGGERHVWPLPVAQAGELASAIDAAIRKAADGGTPEVPVQSGPAARAHALIGELDANSDRYPADRSYWTAMARGARAVLDTMRP